MQLSKDAFKALGIKVDPIDVIGGWTESHFPTQEVCKLEQAIKEEIQEQNKFLQGVCSDIDNLKETIENTAKKEDIVRFELKLDDLKEAQTQEKPGNIIYSIFFKSDSP